MPRIQPTFSLLRQLRGLWRQHPRYRGCVGHWLANEGVGTTVTNLATARFPGTLENAPSWTTWPQGRSVNLNGTTQRWDCGAFPTNSVAMSWAFWSIPSSTSVIKGYLDKYLTSGTNRSFRLWEHSASQSLRVQISPDGSTNEEQTASFSYTVGVPSHYVLTFHQGRFRAYQDGAPISTNGDFSTVTSIYTGNTQTMYVGFRSVGSNYYAGILDDIRIYHRELTAREALSLYANPSLEFEWAEALVRAGQLWALAAAATAVPVLDEGMLVGGMQPLAGGLTA